MSAMVISGGGMMSVVILTKSASDEAVGCEQLAQSRYAAAPWPEIELATLDRKSDALPLRHHATP